MIACCAGITNVLEPKQFLRNGLKFSFDLGSEFHVVANKRKIHSILHFFFSWQVNGKPMKGDQTKFNSALKIKAVEDAVVNCSADNGFGMDWRTATVTVHCE